MSAYRLRELKKAGPKSTFDIFPGSLLDVGAQKVLGSSSNFYGILTTNSFFISFSQYKIAFKLSKYLSKKPLNITISINFNLNKAGLFENSFFWGRGTV